MQIDRTNYEVYFLDYIDGNLSVDLIDDFLEFLNKNPDLKKELQSVAQAPVRLPDEQIPFGWKNELLKNELTGSSDFDYKAIAWMEGDLTGEEKSRFKKELQEDPQKQKDFELITSLRLQPQTTISFPGKNRLLKNSNIKKLLIWSGRIAALLVLGLLIWFRFPANHVETSSRQQASVTSGNKEPSTHEYQYDTLQTEEKQQLQTADKKLVVPPVGKPAIVTYPDQQHAEQPDKTAVLAREQESLALLKPMKIETIRAQPIKAEQLPQYIPKPKEKAEYTKLTDFLAQKLLDIPKGEQLTLASLAKAGLQVAQDISHNKFNIETSNEGHIEEINFNSRLIGFSIPVKKNK